MTKIVLQNINIYVQISQDLSELAFILMKYNID